MAPAELGSEISPGTDETGKLDFILRLAGFLVLTLYAAQPLRAANDTDQPRGASNGQVLTVTSHADSGPGSLRAALEQASQSEQPHRIVFGTAEGPFSVPQVIELSSPLPTVSSKIEIDGHIPGLLWKAYGVTIDGGQCFRVFEVESGGELRVRGITIENGRADTGAGILNRGRLVAEGITLLFNKADDAGGAIANQGSEAYLINSTAAFNRAARGGAVANLAGKLRVTNVTLHLNQAEIGSAIFSLAELTLSNSILTGEDTQCVNSGSIDAASTHNIFTSGRGCGEPIVAADPHLGKLGFYNGPTRTIPITGRSPAINLGHNPAAVDAAGEPLKWDQRGNGDPRFARGYVDIGAFEHQSRLPTEYVVNTLADTKLRGCTAVGNADCPLRAAIELSLAGRQPVPIRFLPRIFSESQLIHLDTLPEGADQALVFDGSGTAGITIVVPRPVPWSGINGARIELESSVSRFQSRQ